MPGAIDGCQRLGGSRDHEAEASICRRGSCSQRTGSAGKQASWRTFSWLFGVHRPHDVRESCCWTLSAASRGILFYMCRRWWHRAILHYCYLNNTES